MMAKWPWRSRSMTPIFKTSSRNLKMHIWCPFGDSSSNPLSYRADKFPRILSQNDLEGQGQWPPFSIPVKNIPGCIKFGDSSPNLWRVISRTIWIPRNSVSKWPKRPWRSRSMTSIFQYQPRVSQDACLVPIWWLQLKFGKIYLADKIKLTDGQTQATAIPHRPERPRGWKRLLHSWLNHWGQVAHICVNIALHNDLTPIWCLTIIWTNADLLSIEIWKCRLQNVNHLVSASMC